MAPADRNPAARHGGYAVNLDALDRLVGSELVVDNLLRRAGTARPDIAGGRHVPAVQNYASWVAIEDEYPATPRPLHVARNLSFEHFTPVLFAAACSRDLNAAAGRIAEHKPLIAPTKLQVDVEPTETTITLSWPGQVPPPESLALSEVLFWVALARLATEHRVTPLHVDVTTLPAAAGLYEDYLGAPLRRGRAQAVVFSAIDSSRPFVHAAEPLWQFFAPELRHQLDEVISGRGTAFEVRVALFEALPVGRTTIEEIADHLAIGVRTLQRRLKAEGVSFQEVLSEVRHELARHYLTASDLPIEEIAFLLGYEDHHSLYRAYHAWSGETPGMLRAPS